MALAPDGPSPGGASPDRVVVPPAAVRRSLRATDLDNVVMTTTLEKALNWASSNSMWPSGFGLACCAMEMIARSSPRYDIARFGAEVFRASPRQADLMIVSGRRRPEDGAADPAALRADARAQVGHRDGRLLVDGGMFANYAVLQGVDKIIPVDVYVPGCPPRPEQ